MERLLNSIFKDVNGWLKFAETKNGVLFAVNGATIFGSFNILFNESLITILVYYFICLIVMSAISIIVVLLSFIPHTTVPIFFALKRPLRTDNYYFYGDVAKYGPEEYLRKLSKNYKIEYDNESKQLIDLAEQIITNSRIALQKFSHFRVAVWLTIIGLFTPFCTLFLYIYLARKGSS